MARRLSTAMLLPEARVIQGRRRDDGVTGRWAELRLVQVGQGSRAENPGDGQPAAEYAGLFAV
jgi:hypothetical protein